MAVLGRVGRRGSWTDALPLWLFLLLAGLPISSFAQPTSRPASQSVSQPASQPVKTAIPPASQPAAASKASVAAAMASRGGKGATWESKKVEKDPYVGLDHTGTPPKPALESKNPSKGSFAASDKREPPPYWGSKRPLTAGSVLVWVPRILLYPAHLVLEYAVRWPIVKLVTVAEENHVFERVVNFFTFADGKAGLFPTVLADGNRGLWGGANFFYNDLFVPGHTLTLNAGLGTSGWFTVQARDSWTVFANGEGRFSVQGGYTREPNLAFAGVGPNSPDEQERFIGHRRGYIDADLRTVLSGLNQFIFGIGYQNTEVGGGRSPSVDAPGSGFDTSTITGFDDPYNLFTVRARLEIDTRDEDRQWTSGSGLRFEAFGSFNFSPSQDLHFFRWGGTAAGFLDFSGWNHVLALRVYFEVLERTGDRRSASCSSSAANPICADIIRGGFVDKALLSRA
jgi:hypothetical protein